MWRAQVPWRGFWHLSCEVSVIALRTQDVDVGGWFRRQILMQSRDTFEIIAHDNRKIYDILVHIRL